MREKATETMSMRMRGLFSLSLELFETKKRILSHQMILIEEYHHNTIQRLNQSHSHQQQPHHTMDQASLSQSTSLVHPLSITSSDLKSSDLVQNHHNNDDDNNGKNDDFCSNNENQNQTTPESRIQSSSADHNLDSHPDGESLDRKKKMRNQDKEEDRLRKEQQNNNNNDHKGDVEARSVQPQPHICHSDQCLFLAQSYDKSYNQPQLHSHSSPDTHLLPLTHTYPSSISLPHPHPCLNTTDVINTTGNIETKNESDALLISLSAPLPSPLLTLLYQCCYKGCPHWISFQQIYLYFQRMVMGPETHPAVSSILQSLHVSQSI